MARTKKDPFVYRPAPTLTPHEVMAQADAVHMLNLARDLTTYMPSPYKERLRRDGCLSIKLGDYRVQVTLSSKFEQPVGEYGKATWPVLAT